MVQLLKSGRPEEAKQPVEVKKPIRDANEVESLVVWGCNVATPLLESPSIIDHQIYAKQIRPGHPAGRDVA